MHGEIDLPHIPVVPETIMAGKIAVLSINFIEGLDEFGLNEGKYIDGDNGKAIAAVVKLREIVAKWYVSLRNLALVGLLSVLVYTGIKIILSTTAQDKAKYKERIMDWIVAICLLFFLHYIMMLTIKITESITDMLDYTDGQISLFGDDEITTNGVMRPEKFIELIRKYGVSIKLDESSGFFSDDNVKYYCGNTEINSHSHSDDHAGEYMEWSYEGKQYAMKFTYNFDMSVLNPWDDRAWDDPYRWTVEEFSCDGEAIAVQGDIYTVSNLPEFTRLYTELKDSNMVWSFLLIYLVLAIYTIVFTFIYLKRTIHMAFLTLIAPLVALTYPIDKMKDGQAQAFNMWLKEYVFNALIQPFHLLIYMILVGSSLEFATSNLIYALVAIGFVFPAEKILRKFFGFENASTLSKAGSFAGGALFASMFGKLRKPPKIPGLGGKKGDKDGGRGDSGDSSSGDDDKINYYNNNADSALDSLGNGGLPEGNQDEGQGEDARINEYRDDLTDEDKAEVARLEASRDNLNEFGDQYGHQEHYDAAKEDDMALDKYRQNSKYDSKGNLIENGTDKGNGKADSTPTDSTPTDSTPTDLTPVNSTPSRFKGNGKLKRMINGVRNSRMLRYGWSGLRRGVLSKKGAKRIIRGAAKLTKGATKLGMRAVGVGAGATIGLAAGVASGDPSKAFQYASLGAGAGYAVGGSVVDVAEGAIKTGAGAVKGIPKTVERVKDDYHRTVDTQEEYKEYKKSKNEKEKEKAIKEFKENDTELSKSFGKQEANRIMEEALPEYFDNNITSAKEIAAIEKHKEDIMKQQKIDEKEARRQSMQKFRVNKELKSRGITKDKDKIEEIQGRLENNGVDGEMARLRAKDIVEGGHKINSYINKNDDK